MICVPAVGRRQGRINVAIADIKKKRADSEQNEESHRKNMVKEKQKEEGKKNGFAKCTVPSDKPFYKQTTIFSITPSK